MRNLAVILGALGLVCGALADEPGSPAGAPPGGADARKHLADFFLRRYQRASGRGRASIAWLMSGPLTNTKRATCPGR